VGNWICLAMELEAASPEGFGEAAVEALAEALADFFNVSLPGRLEHRYSPQGLSFVRHGAKGRLALHTWPELNVATLDFWAPQDILLDRVETLSDWFAKRGRHRVVSARLHPHPRGPAEMAD